MKKEATPKIQRDSFKKTFDVKRGNLKNTKELI
jgi:hypothetical protein